MTCLSTRRLISAYIDSELSPDEMLEVRHHLFKCPECSAEHDALLKAKASVSGLCIPEPSDELLKLIACRPWETGDDVARCHSTASTRSLRGTEQFRLFHILRNKYVSSVAAVLVFSISIGVGLATSGLSRVTPQASLAESFKAEHQRFRYASPLSGSPDTVEFGQLSEVAQTLGEHEAIGGSSETLGGGALVSYVSQVTSR